MIQKWLFIKPSRDYSMRFLAWVASICFAFALQGCVGTDGIIDGSAQHSLQSLQLFGSGSSPQFTFYLACTSDDISCINAKNAFSRWTDERNIVWRTVDPDDSLFRGGMTSERKNTKLPYRLAVRIAPIVIPSFQANADMSGNGDMRSSYKPPKVGYSGTIYVFDSITGKLLLTTHVGEQREVTEKEDAGADIRAEMNRLIRGLDPTYQSR